MNDNFPAAVSGVPALENYKEADRVLARIRDYFALTKPEINALILISTMGGFFLASAGGAELFAWKRLLIALAGTLLLASGAAALNQAMERRYDCLMRRTMRRPVAAGRVSPAHAWAFGMILAAVGAAGLFAGVNMPAGLAGLLAIATYLLFYTPLKRKTPYCTIVGAMAGAAPVLIGWFAGGGTLTAAAAIPYALLFLWQFPHFMSIASIHKADYERAGYQVIPGQGNQRRFIAFWTIVPGAALWLLVAAPAVAQRSTIVLVAAACILSLGFLWYGVRFAVRQTAFAARQLLAASILHVPLALILLIVIAKNGIRTF